MVCEGRGITRRMVRASLETWWARLRQRVRVMAAWAVELAGEDRAWIVRGTGSVATAAAGAVIATHDARRAARAEREARLPTTATRMEEREPVDGDTDGDARRRSDRLRGETRQYREARERGVRTQQAKRQAVPAALSTREGIRLWWWLAGGEGSDARGAISVERGRRQRGDG